MNAVLMDANIQYIAERALERLCAKHTPTSACVVVVNPNTARFGVSQSSYIQSEQAG